MTISPAPRRRTMRAAARLGLATGVALAGLALAQPASAHEARLPAVQRSLPAVPHAPLLPVVPHTMLPAVQHGHLPAVQHGR